MSKSNILVTGGAGYIGSHTCKALSNLGYIPIVYDNLIYGNEWAVKWGPFEKGDIANQSRLNEVIKKYQPSAIIHFAAYAYVGESVKDPGKYYQNNVVGSINLLESIRDFGIEKIIFSSSCASYGIPDSVPIEESHLQNPVNPYGASKFMTERILKDFSDAYGIKSISLRYFNASGADPEMEVGECHEPETHLIPLILDVALGKRKKISVYGDNYDTTDGTCVRDYVHVTDIADAHILALKALENGAPTSVYNLGNGAGYSVKEVIKVAREVTGHPIPVEIKNRRQGDVGVLIGSSKKIEKELGWRPKLGNLHRIIETAWQWHKAYQTKLVSKKL